MSIKRKTPLFLIKALLAWSRRKPAKYFLYTNFPLSIN
nr:MAG TPA: hypothetical protein [Caudoviricetes sp.]